MGNVGVQYRHIHGCKRCSCRWNCDCESCQSIHMGLCPWCEAGDLGYEGKPLFVHDCTWSVGYEGDSDEKRKRDGCNICRHYNQATQFRLKEDAQAAIQ